MCGSIAEWLGSRTCDQQVAGSNPGRLAAEYNPGQVVYTHVPLPPSSIMWYQPMVGDAHCSAAGQVTSGLAEINGSLPPSVYGFDHLRADCRGPASAPEPGIL